MTTAMGVYTQRKLSRQIDRSQEVVAVVDFQYINRSIQQIMKLIMLFDWINMLDFLKKPKVGSTITHHALKQ